MKLTQPLPTLCLATLLALSGACRSPADPAAEAPRPGDWEARLADASISRAEDFYRRGEVDAAREAGRQALFQALEAGHRLTEARALVLLARIDQSIEGLALAEPLIESSSGNEELLLTVRLELAEGYMDLGDPERALLVAHQLAEQLAHQAGALDDRDLGARYRALTFHFQAAAHRRDGNHAAALPSERRALLSLSVLADDERLPLRRAVAQGLGDDLAATGDPATAFEWHARASDLAHRLDDTPARARAVLGMARDLTALGRPRDAHDHATRGLELARTASNPRLLADMARCGLGALHALDEPADSPRFAIFRQALAEAAAQGADP